MYIVHFDTAQCTLHLNHYALTHSVIN